ncbi:MAG TPA: PAAR domain-containing protein [Ilumatobacteraceae bacterium]|nr:PAAR domain-containing protein [Ilumatobacteraceae bacterium]
MGTPAAVMGDKITATCAAHQIPNPTSGAPQPGPPFPFSAAITTKCEPKVLIGGKPAVVVGSSGLNVPPHVGLHPSDTFATPPKQKGTVVQGSPTVQFGGKAAARTGSACTVCFGAPGQLAGTASTVLIA